MASSGDSPPIFSYFFFPHFVVLTGPPLFGHESIGLTGGMVERFASAVGVEAHVHMQVSGRIGGSVLPSFDCPDC